MAKVKDLVCDMWVDTEVAPAKFEYKGKTYYFCAPGCMHMFKEDPEKYISKEEHEEKHHDHNHGHGHGCCH